ncbi:hypothetical protein ACWH9X_26110, partial [Paenibacillus terrae]
YVLEDGTAERNVLLGLHKFTKRFDKQVYLDVYTDHEILHYTIGNDDKGNQMKQNQSPELKYIGKHITSLEESRLSPVQLIRREKVASMM